MGSLRLFTGSEADRADLCPVSCCLPRIARTTEESTFGTVAHAFLARARGGDREAALAEVPEEHRARCAAIDLDALPLNAESEVALAWDPATDRAERLGLAAHRDYPHDGRRIFLTLDLVGLDGDAVVVADYKTGVMTRRASESLQLGAGALFAARYTGRSAARVSMLYLRSDGSWYPDRAALDAFDLAGVADRLRRIVARVEAARADLAAGLLPEMTDGPHCTYCDSQPFCPAVTLRVRQAAAGDEQALAAPLAGLSAKARATQLGALWAEKVEALTAEQAGACYERLKLAGEVVATGEEALRERARREPLPLSGGRELRELPWGTRAVWSEVAKAEREELERDLARRGEITRVAATQVRAVARKDR